MKHDLKFIRTLYVSGIYMLGIVPDLSAKVVKLKNPSEHNWYSSGKAFVLQNAE